MRLIAYVKLFTLSKMSGNATLNRSLIRRRRRRKPYDHRNMRKWWTNEWFLENRIAIITVTNHVGASNQRKVSRYGYYVFLW